jgi:hypothetical protein
MLNWPAVAAVGELLGAFAVVASLVYVGQQVKQNTVSLHAAAQQSAIDAIGELSVRMVESSELFHVFNRGMAAPAELSPTERTRFYYLCYNALKGFEQAHFHAVHGNLDADTWSGLRVVVATYVTAPGFRDYWADREAMFSRRFAALVRDLQAEGGLRRLAELAESEPDTPA